MTAKDLSQVHGPVENLLGPDAQHADRQAWRLSDQQLEQFRTDGYVSGVRILSDEQVDQLRDELTRLLDPNHDGRELFHEYHSNESANPDTVLFHALGAWRVAPGFHDLLWHPAFTTAAAQLLEGPVRFWHDQLFCKPAKHGGVVAWHQDYSYWTRTVPQQHLTCWIALDDVDESNGALKYIPGSHRWNLLPITGLAGDMQAIRGVLTEQQWADFQPRTMRLKRGEASFHHPLMVHGSEENHSDRPRRATVLNVFRDGTLSDSEEPLMPGTPPIPPGRPVTGQFFPLLTD